MKPIIRVENLSKQYRIGARRNPHPTLRESIAGAVRTPLNWFGRNGHSEDNTIWALRDVSFEVMPGEVVGVIGRNGAGKSTLLKILSRITEPTTGQVDLYGRVGSLLEVGTGFHAELSGRENIYLNGAILGMKRSEIDRKFDEIVAFAEVEKFIDTPVKHYSSGMHMRLAFSVAANLEPEILIVDEVLAVGDVAFQSKCLGKMEGVAREGKTILFVSHNMQAIRSMCRRAIQLQSGEIVADDQAQKVVESYNSSLDKITGEAVWGGLNAPGNEEVKLVSIRVIDGDGASRETYPSSKDLLVVVEFEVFNNNPSLCVGFDLTNLEIGVVCRSYHTDTPTGSQPKLKIGRNKLVCKIPPGLLNGGSYYICPRIGVHNLYWIVHLEGVVKFNVYLDHSSSPFWNTVTAEGRPGAVAPILAWEPASV